LEAEDPASLREQDFLCARDIRVSIKEGASPTTQVARRAAGRIWLIVVVIHSVIGGQDSPNGLREHRGQRANGRGHARRGRGMPAKRDHYLVLARGTESSWQKSLTLENAYS
jgi:hypothetical protein